MAVDYLGRAELGQGLEMDISSAHAGRPHGVAHAFVTADGHVIAPANASFRIG